MDRLTGLRAFCLVAEHLRFRLAADRLGLSPAMVSRHILHLESDLGVRLINRNSRNVALTDEGRAYHERVKPLIEELDHLDSAISSRTSVLDGILRISAPTWMSNARFAQVLADFAALHDGVRFQVDLSARAVNLIDEGYDLALRVSSRLSPGLIARPLRPITFGLYGNPHYLAQHGTPMSADDLVKHRLLAYRDVQASNFLKGDVEDGASIAPERLMSSENEALLTEAALCGMGLVVLPDWIADGHVKEGSLVRVLASSFHHEMALQIVYSSRKLLHPRVRLFIDHLVASLAHRS